MIDFNVKDIQIIEFKQETTVRHPLFKVNLYAIQPKLIIIESSDLLHFEENIEKSFKVLKEYIVKDLPFYLKQPFLTDGVGDTGYIEGIVKEKGVPVSRRVFCYHRRSAKLVGSTLSDDEGYYKFSNLVIGATYFVVSIDEFSDDIQYPAVIQDLIPARSIL